nr:hypothetical protein [Pseudopedobacter sp.]
MNYARIGKVIESHDNALFRSVREKMTPVLNDTSLIEPMFAKFSLSYGDSYEDRILFISTILVLFSPSTIYFDTKVENNVCLTLSSVMNMPHRQTITPFISSSKAYFKGERFNRRVLELSKELRNDTLAG